MAKILVTPGCKDRLSATVGRLIAGSWTTFNGETGYYAYAVDDALELALSIEKKLTKAVQVEPSDPQARF